MQVDPQGHCFFALGNAAILYSMGLNGEYPCKSFQATLGNDYYQVGLNIPTTRNVFVNDKDYLPGASYLVGNPKGAQILETSLSL
jgi:hypothetical protein